MSGIEQHVTSLELSRRLNELGVKRERSSVFYWVRKGKEIWELVGNNGLVQFAEYYYRAYLASETGEMLPDYIYEPGQTYIFTIERDCKKWCISYEKDECSLFPTMTDAMLSNALSKMLIYLIENGHVKTEDL